MVFQGSIPAWSPGCPWGGSRAQKHVKMEAQTQIFYDFRKMFSRYLETLWKYFVCSLKNKLVVLDVKYGYACLGLGGKPKVDASQMLARYVPDGSKIPPSLMIPPPRFLVIAFSSVILRNGLQRNSVWGLALGHTSM